MKTKSIISVVLRIVAAVILFQTLYFKFTSHPESVALFTKLGVEPWGRIATGVIELIAVVLLLLPSTVILGALLGIGLMLGAIIAHITAIGIASNGDGGLLFVLALIELALCTVLVVLNKNQGYDMLRALNLLKY